VNDQREHQGPADAIFAVLADPAKRAAIDGTGWVRDPLDRQPLTASGQIFRMAMYHVNHAKWPLARCDNRTA
jgi:hypothetical protein